MRVCQNGIGNAVLVNSHLTHPDNNYNLKKNTKCSNYIEPYGVSTRAHSVRRLSVAQVLFCKNSGSVREETA